VFFNAIDLARDAVDDVDSFALMCRHYPVIAVDDAGTEPSVVKHYGTEFTPLTELIYTRYDVQKPLLRYEMQCAACLVW
jgi:DNA replication protein DnaC